MTTVDGMGLMQWLGKACGLSEACEQSAECSEGRDGLSLQKLGPSQANHDNRSP